MKRKLLAIILAVVMVLSVVALAACTDPHTCESECPTCHKCTNKDCKESACKDKCDGHESDGDPEIEGYFSFSYDAGIGNAYRFLHFYSDPGYGAVVYAGAQTGTYSQNGAVSYYTVEKKDFSYAVWSSRADVTKDEAGNVDTTDATKGTAPYTVTFKSVTDDSVIGTCGFDGENLYTGGPQDVNFFPAAGRSDTHNLIIPKDAAGDRMPSAYGEESGVELFTFYSVENSKYQILIYHTGRYANALTDTVQTGTVTYANGVFTLSRGGTITVTDTAITYKNGDTTVALSTTPSEPAKKAVITLEGVVEHDQMGEAPIKLVCYDDGTCELIVAIPGMGDSVLDSGTYSNSAMGIPEKATLETAGEIAISVDFTTMSLSADIPAYADAGFGASTVTASLGTPEEPEVLLALEGTAQSSYGFSAPIKLVLYTDGTCEVIVTVQGNDNVLDSGTYTNSGFGIPEKATLETAGEVTISVDFTTMGLSAELPEYTESGFAACTVTGSLPSQQPEEPEEPEVLLTLEGTAQSSYGFSAPIKLVLYDDGTCEVIITVQGSDNVIDSGTYTNSDLGIPNKATLETAGEVTISVDFTSMSLSAEIPAYTEAGFEASTVSCPLPM